MAMAFEQIVGRHGIAIVQPAFFGVVERAFQKIARPMEAENRHAALLGS
jgi:hypothetical protein